MSIKTITEKQYQSFKKLIHQTSRFSEYQIKAFEREINKYELQIQTQTQPVLTDYNEEINDMILFIRQTVITIKNKIVVNNINTDIINRCNSFLEGSTRIRVEQMLLNEWEYVI